MARAGPPRGNVAPAIAAAVLATSALGLAALQYLIPRSARFPGPVYTDGARDYGRFLFGSGPAPLPVSTFVALFALAVVLMWAAYAGLLYVAHTRGLHHPWRFFAAAVALAAVISVVFPTSLTHDVFAYLGFARMGAVHGLNPYSTTLEYLAQAGDIAAQRYPAPHADVYGPAWTLLSTGIAWVLRGAPLMAQAIALKAVEAIALGGGALAARAVAKHTMPECADVALVAFAFNPLLLIEGPGNGHVDVLMVAILVAGLALLAKGMRRAGFFVVGVSVAVKFVTLAIVPLLILSELDRHARSRTGIAAESGVLALLPLGITAAPYLVDADPLAAVAGLFGSRATAAGNGLLPVAVMVTLYAIVCAWLSRAPRELGRLSAAWVSWSAISLHFAFPGTLPWYFAWPTGVAVTAWDRRSVAITAACSLLALRWMLSYIMLR